MDLEAIRRIVEAEVDRALAGALGKRRVVTERMVEDARRRGADAVEHPPGALVTPAARDRARDLRIALREVAGGLAGHPDLRRDVIERVMAEVLARLRRRPDPSKTPSRGQ